MQIHARRTPPTRPWQAALGILGALLATLTLPALAATSSDGVWEAGDSYRLVHPTMETRLQDVPHRTVTLNRAALEAILSKAPFDTKDRLATGGVVLTLPLPDGGFGRFSVIRSHVMEDGPSSRSLSIRTYRGQGLDDPNARVRFELTRKGFSALIRSAQGNIAIDLLLPKEDRVYGVYDVAERPAPEGGFTCEVDGTSRIRSSGKTERKGIDATSPMAIRPVPSPEVAAGGSTLHSYRIAVATTSSYTAYASLPDPPNKSDALDMINAALNRLNEVFETELSVHLNLVGNNGLIVYGAPDSAPDPYTSSDCWTNALTNATNIKNVLGNSNFDVGHLFMKTAAGSAGCAGREATCWNGGKGRGATGSVAPNGEIFWIDFVAHELGHQFGARHSFNGALCSERDSAGAREPGSGTTIMSYAGICGADNVQAHADPYFHSHSIEEIQQYLGALGGNCAVDTSTGNGAPSVDAGATFSIPIGTPFTLTAASASDPNGDPLTFSWEERDQGVALTLAASDNGQSPLFRVFPPATSLSRTFPQLSDILNNVQTPGEKLPALARTMEFAVTVRDNRTGGGGINGDTTTVNVTQSAGPFVVTAPASGASWAAGTQIVTWNVANTTAAPLNATTVNILLSTDGGLTFPTALASATPNDGSQAVTIPSVYTTTARIKVAPVGQVFFDINDGDFTIPPPNCPSVTPCNGTNCTRSSETGDTDTGLHACLQPGNQVLDCGSQNVHVVSTFCAFGQCCFAQPPCVCFNCPGGSYLECR